MPEGVRRLSYSSRGFPSPSAHKTDLPDAFLARHPKVHIILHLPILFGLTKSKSGSPKFKDRSSPAAFFPPSLILAEKSFVTSGTTIRPLTPSKWTYFPPAKRIDA